MIFTFFVVFRVNIMHKLGENPFSFKIIMTIISTLILTPFTFFFFETCNDLRGMEIEDRSRPHPLLWRIRIWMRVSAENNYARSNFIIHFRQN